MARLGMSENCQVGVFMSYISDRGHTLIARRLYLPRTWAEDESKRKKAVIRESIEFATKPQLAQQMLQSAIIAGIRPAWFVADEVYGDGSRTVVAGANRGTTLCPHGESEAVCGKELATLSSLGPSSTAGQSAVATTSVVVWVASQNDTTIGQGLQLIAILGAAFSVGSCSVAPYTLFCHFCKSKFCNPY